MPPRSLRMTALTLYHHPHTRTMRLLWLMLVPVLFAAAGPTNHTVDDASPQWIINPGPNPMICYACTDTKYGLDPTKLNNGTFAQFPWATAPPRTAIYVFVPVQAINNPLLPSMEGMFFELDGVDVGNYTPPTPWPSEPQYNVSAFAKTGLTDATHTIILSVPNGGMLDYVVYTSNEPDVASSSSSASQPGSTPTTVSSSAQLSPTRGAPQISSGSTGKKKPRTAAIAGGVVGGIAAISIFLVGLLLVSRARRNKGQKTPGAKPPATDPSVQSKEPVQLEAEAPFVAAELSRGQESATPASGRDDHGLTEQVRLLTDEVQRLRQRVDGSSTTASDRDSLSRSISTIKREQTQVLHQHGQLGTHVTDSLIRTDSGIRLTAGRAEEDLPPTYDAD
ncbi:hypothetical protein DFH06DRAFT_1416674 [Mycena polygramma]|nr:hypothetical protein DFH06DRAFT_1416674 [Mycena polygramma]